MNQRSLAQTFSLIFGIAFLAAGVLGFVPGITTNLGDISFAGSDSRSELLGIFQVSVLHNIVHLLFGIAGVALARTTESAKSYLLVSASSTSSCSSTASSSGRTTRTLSR